MTTLQSGVRDRTVGSCALTGVATSASVIHVRLDVEWPCLARAIDPNAGPTEEIRVRARCSLKGPPDTLRGRLIVDAIGFAGGSSAVQLADRSARGMLHDREPWRVVALACDASDRGGLAFEFVLPIERSDSIADPIADPVGGRLGSQCPTEGVSYIRSDLMAWLGVVGGRYGRPVIHCSVVPNGPPYGLPQVLPTALPLSPELA